MVAEVVQLYDNNFRDVVSTLRLLADHIESGEYGEVEEAVVLVNADSDLEIFGLGNSDTGTIRLLLGAASLKFDRAVLDRE